MSNSLSESAQQRLQVEKNIWVATTRPDGRPHLTPVWFAWFSEKIYICIPEKSVKARNLTQNPRMAMSLEDGVHPLICEGIAHPIPKPGPVKVQAIFKAKYDWDYVADEEYGLLVEITPEKWLVW
ncbi:MAG: pyridoxamine 5'-phosphate oxidase [Anaerolineae bacterium]|nr:pyridoxamine 5'-phosphate oxidase [Anaerolineae bacterium]